MIINEPELVTGIKNIPNLPSEILNQKIIRAAFRVAIGEYDGIYDCKKDSINLQISWSEFRICLLFLKQFFRLSC